MPRKIRVILGLILMVGCLSLTSGTAVTPPTKSAVYLEPKLRTVQSETVSVIVTATNAQVAAQAVEAVGGQVSSELWIINAVAARVSAEQLNSLASQPGVVSIVDNKEVDTADGPADADGWVTDYRFSVPWDGSADVVATDNFRLWELVYPVTIDIGADIIHQTEIEDKAIRGNGVTIAVVDSGVFFSNKLKKHFGTSIGNWFVGQADYVADGQCNGQTNKDFNAPTMNVQANGFCWQGYDKSRDPYGHGSHVVGIIRNGLKDNATKVFLGAAPKAKILSVRVLDDDGRGTYEDVIQGIQGVIENKDKLNIGVMNMSLSAQATTPYFVDPINRAVEKAWQAGIIVVAAAGNAGPQAETITVPGNDPYVITVGAIDGQRTPGYWRDDTLPTWSSTGPTRDGFIKPDVLAPGTNIISYMFNNHKNAAKSAYLVQQHPDYSQNEDLFRMNGTSMATAVTSGVVSLMLQADPSLTPDQVKYRLMASAQHAQADTGEPVYNLFRQGAGRIWAPYAIFGDFPDDARANQGLDIDGDLAHGWTTSEEMGSPLSRPH